MTKRIATKTLRHKDTQKNYIKTPWCLGALVAKKRRNSNEQMV